ncbi:MAG: T9SS type A sorting domain-containing protein, partial [Bacteroidales bacterium]|nr:T9SS type A sorting domain-containing protein [Bacteroidales bacterium]
IDDIVLSYAQDAVCGINSLSWDESFEGYATNEGATGVEPDCWEVVTEDVALDASTRPQLYAEFNTTAGGHYTLRMRNRCVYAMPELSAAYDVKDLTMTFNLRQPKTFYRLQVGVLDADSNFELVEEINNASLDIESVSVDFSSYTGSGHRIAFRNVLKGKRYEYSYNYLDDIHIDLTANVAPTKSVSDLTEEADAAEYLERITVYPNPTTDVVNVQCTMDNVHCSGIEVIDVYGKVVRTVVGANNYSPTQINVSGLAAGMYYVRVTTDRGVVTKPFVKR